jgi:hypothetical protein
MESQKNYSGIVHPLDEIALPLCPIGHNGVNCALLENQLFVDLPVAVLPYFRSIFFGEVSFFCLFHELAFSEQGAASAPALLNEALSEETAPSPRML